MALAPRTSWRGLGEGVGGAACVCAWGGGGELAGAGCDQGVIGNGSVLREQTCVWWAARGWGVGPCHGLEQQRAGGGGGYSAGSQPQRQAGRPSQCPPAPAPHSPTHLPTPARPPAHTRPPEHTYTGPLTLTPCLPTCQPIRPPNRPTDLLRRDGVEGPQQLQAALRHVRPQLLQRHALGLLLQHQLQAAAALAPTPARARAARPSHCRTRRRAVWRCGGGRSRLPGRLRYWLRYGPQYEAQVALVQQLEQHEHRVDGPEAPPAQLDAAWAMMMMRAGHGRSSGGGGAGKAACAGQA